MAETLNPRVDTGRFLKFTGEVRRSLPELNQKLYPFFSAPRELVPSDDWVRQAFDKYGKDYIEQEPTEALGMTMYMLLENLRAPKGRERWLSLGSGPGLYEIFLASRIPGVTITSVDISAEQLDVQAQLIDRFTKPQDRVKERLTLVRGSMDDLSQVGEGFNQIFCINALHWCQDWKRATAEIGRVLSPAEGSRVYVVLGSASMVDTTGKRPIRDAINTDMIINEFESLGLKTVSLGHVNLTRGQLGLKIS